MSKIDSDELDEVQQCLLQLIAASRMHELVDPFVLEHGAFFSPAAPSVHRFTAAGCAGGTEVSFVQIDGGGHTWLDASFASGQFFATHGR
jgi:hypothetical protein